jgi:hypothetical protein
MGDFYVLAGTTLVAHIASFGAILHRSTVLRPGEELRSTTTFRLGVD